MTGVLLIFLNDALHPNALFWHEVKVNKWTELNTVTTFPLGNFSLRIDVQGDLYSAYLNGSTTPATTFVSSLFASGYTGVYDHDVFNNGAQSFDNFLVTAETPLPAALPLFASGSALLGFLGWRRKRTAIATA